MFIANGCSLPRHALQLTWNSQDGDLARMSEVDVSEIFGSSVVTRTELSANTLITFCKSQKTPGRGSRIPIVLLLERHGVFGCRAKDKRVPKEIFKQSQSGIACFLAALFSADGCFFSNPVASDGKSKVKISLASASRGLLDDVKLLLQSIGILSIVRPVKQRQYLWFNLEIVNRENKIRFCNIVGAIGRRDIGRLRKCSRILSRQDSDNSFKGMEAARFGNVAFIQVDSIRPLGLRKVYDIEMPGETRNFVANGIIVHNSLEQDADVVLALYNPEDEKEDESGETSEGTKTDLIILKNRSGPKSTVELTFLKPYTRFESSVRVNKADVPEHPTQQQENLV
jgi:replicative DNA helicase